MRLVSAAVAVLLLAAASCHGGPHGYHVVGASRMAQIEAKNGGHGTTGSGQGYITDRGYGVLELTPPTQPLTIITVNVHDRDELDLTRYSEVHDYYAGFGPVVWVALPPLWDAFNGRWLVDPTDADAFNARVAAQVGCELVPASTQTAETFDGLHFTERGADQVTLNFTLIDDSQAC